MRMYPQPGFSLPRRTSKLAVSAGSGGRLRRRPRRRPRRSARCQRRSVHGLTTKHDHRSSGSRRLAAKNARSADVYRGPPASAQNRKLVAEHQDLEIALAADPDDHPDQPAQSRYSMHTATTLSLKRLVRTHEHNRLLSRTEFLYPTGSP